MSAVLVQYFVPKYSCLTGDFVKNELQSIDPAIAQMINNSIVIHKVLKYFRNILFCMFSNG